MNILFSIIHFQNTNKWLVYYFTILLNFNTEVHSHKTSLFAIRYLFQINATHCCKISIFNGNNKGLIRQWFIFALVTIVEIHTSSRKQKPTVKGTRFTFVITSCFRCNLHLKQIFIFLNAFFFLNENVLKITKISLKTYVTIRKNNHNVREIIRFISFAIMLNMQIYVLVDVLRNFVKKAWIIKKKKLFKKK